MKKTKRRSSWLILFAFLLVITIIGFAEKNKLANMFYPKVIYRRKYCLEEWQINTKKENEYTQWKDVKPTNLKLLFIDINKNYNIKLEVNGSIDIAKKLGIAPSIKRNHSVNVSGQYTFKNPERKNYVWGYYYHIIEHKYNFIRWGYIIKQKFNYQKKVWENVEYEDIMDTSKSFSYTEFKYGGIWDMPEDEYRTKYYGKVSYFEHEYTSKWPNPKRTYEYVQTYYKKGW
ncbi:hypothetical protein OSSY52_09520 [Tepiditoga spiralis]|uniref:Uncharacterized protein n=1 Tax=Tepiditoga spiralis TaxID=2108365 RepID=A0A7G1G371_9BACT|nr:hypothetical protein [Tepiditoga spiralis]BBE30811.1 hypothetical protein OSSY52_09520 [Tepiditoga spiralis]